MTQGFDFVIDKTWNNKEIEHMPVKGHMEWKFEKQSGQPHKRVILTRFEAQLFDDPDPPSDFSGYCSNVRFNFLFKFFLAL